MLSPLRLELIGGLQSATGYSLSPSAEEILREFTWIFDVPHKSVFIEPNGWFHKPELDDHSGLVLDTRNVPARVLYVYAKSAAANAGIGIGDELTGNDGQPLTTDEWHDLLDAAPGTVVTIRVTHGATSRVISMTLNPYI